MYPNIQLIAVTFGVAGALVGAAEQPRQALVLDWRVPNISRVISVDTDFHSGIELHTPSRHGRVVKRGKHQCVRASYLLFDVDDEYAFNVDERVTLDILVDAEDTDGFYLAYDHASLVPFPINHRVSTQGKRFRWERLVIERARFANRRLGRADFSIAALASSSFSPVLEEGVFALLDDGASRNQEFTVCGVRLTRSYESPPRNNVGSLRITLRDESGGPSVARVGLYDAGGWSPLPSRRVVGVDRLGVDVTMLPLIDGQERWPGSGRYIFFVDDAYDTQLPAGDYTLVVSRGPEGRIDIRDLTIYTGQTVDVELGLERWHDMTAQGWYAGDGHIHTTGASRNTTGLDALLRAEDLHVANFMTAQCMHDELHVNAELFGFAYAPATAAGSGAAVAREIALGNVTLYEILRYGRLETELYYDFLNMGFKLTPTAGSHFPYLNLPGAERSYVQVAGEFSVDRWLSGLHAGRTFVTNGPMLSLDVHSAGMGNTLTVDRGAQLEIKAAAQVNPDFDRLDRLELIVHGDVVAVAGAVDQADELKLHHVLTVNEGVWIPVRATGEAGTLAHSAPVYITLRADEGRFAKRGALPKLVAKYRAKLSATRVERDDASRQHVEQAMTAFDGLLDVYKLRP